MDLDKTFAIIKNDDDRNIFDCNNMEQYIDKLLYEDNLIENDLIINIIQTFNTSNNSDSEDDTLWKDIDVWKLTDDKIENSKTYIELNSPHNKEGSFFDNQYCEIIENKNNILWKEISSSSESIDEHRIYEDNSKTLDISGFYLENSNVYKYITNNDFFPNHNDPLQKLPKDKTNWLQLDLFQNETECLKNKDEQFWKDADVLQKTCQDNEKTCVNLNIIQNENESFVNNATPYENIDYESLIDLEIELKNAAALKISSVQENKDSAEDVKQLKLHEEICVAKKTSKTGLKKNVNKILAVDNSNKNPVMECTQNMKNIRRISVVENAKSKLKSIFIKNSYGSSIISPSTSIDSRMSTVD